jgi:putative DNA primase/helicase
MEFADRYADTLRYVAQWSKWFVWDGMIWRDDRTRSVFTRANRLCHEIARSLNKGSARMTIANAKTRAAVVALAGEDPRLVATIDQWDTDPWLLNTPRGVVDLRTGKMREHRANDYMTKITAVGPEPGSDCPRWKAFMSQITNGDGELQRYLQRISGYALTGITTEQELYFFYGTGNNGKGVWILVVSGILNDYHTAAAIETFTQNKFDRHPTELAKLRGARLVTAAETEEGRYWNESRIKQLTGGDAVDARLMRQDFFSFYPQFKLLFSGNHMPTLHIVNKAIVRRFNRIPFNVTIPDDQINKNLAAELKEEEAVGILNWMIEGCMEWQKIGMCPPQAVTEATDSYLEGQDTIGAWIEDSCDKDAQAFESTTDLFDSWKPWAEGREERVGSVKTFSSKLEDRGLRKGRNKEQTKKGFYGLKLKTRAPQEPEPKVTLRMYIQKETNGGNGKDHEGAVLVSFSREGDGVWLPKTQIKCSEPGPDGRVEVAIPIWLAKKTGLAVVDGGLPF